MAPLPPLVLVTDAPSDSPSTPPRSRRLISPTVPSAPNTPSFTISPADEDSPTANSPSQEGSPSPTSRAPSVAAYGSDTSEPSPSTSLGLRGNVDPDGKRQALEQAHSIGLSYPPSSTAYSTNSSDEETGKGHQRRPSQALSFTSTVPDAHEDHRDDPSDAPEEAPKRRLFGLLAPKPVLAPIVKADPTPEEMGPFATNLMPSHLYALIDPKSIDQLTKLGGIEGVLAGLGTDAEKGLQDAGGDIPLSERERVYGINRVPERKGKSLLRLMWMAYQDKVLIILSIAAVVSLALGLYQDLGTPPVTYASTSCANNLCIEPQLDWVEGVAITIAIFIVVIVGSVNDYQKESQFRKLNAKKEERNVKVIRDGSERLMSVYSVLVGDILYVEPGEILPVDGLFLRGHNVRCDESGATGESDAVRKLSYGELVKGTEGKADCFLISGSKVLEGVGTYVVTSVGENSFHGKIMMSLRGDAEDTPLQLKLNALAELIAKLGSAAGLILFSCLMIRFFVQLATDSGRTAQVKAQNFIQILIISVTIVVVAVPEGLPLAVTLALAFATRRMTKQALLVRVLGACETMANATVICTDKTGTLTQNKMSVVAGAIGVHLKFADHLAENAARSNANDDADPEKQGEKETSTTEARKGRLDFSSDIKEINSHVSPALRRLLNDSIAINSTAFEGTDEHGEMGGFVGSKTETALLAFAKGQGWDDYKTTRQGAKIMQMIPFSSERKAMGAVLELPGGGYRLLIKGASEVLAKISTRHVVVTENFVESAAAAADASIPTEDFTDETRANITRTIIFYANQSLRTIALCSRDFPRWPPVGCVRDEAGDVDFADLAKDLTLVAITAIEDPLRDGVTEAVATCQTAGVAVKMCTGDNVLTARSIATQCGIYSAGGVIMEGPVFRKLTVAERNEIVPRLQVLARSSPEDKKILVEHLKSMGEVVGVTGDGTNDGPALKTANVGFSMGIAGTEVAKEASDIILMDDNFSSIVSAIMWGRCVNDSVKKFLQFQISVNITAVVITFISAVASSDETSVLTAVQLLWVNLIMDTFAALALATDPADPESLQRKPDRKTAPLISVQMWMMIIGQALYQTIVALVLHFAGNAIFGFNSTDTATAIDQQNELNTLVFNTFVWCQIFNQLNARRLDRGLNVFTGILKNYYFIVIFFIMIAGQIIIVEVGGPAFQVVRIGGRDWAISIILGALSLPLAVLIRLLPPAPFERLMIKLRLFPDPSAPLPTVSPLAEDERWNEGISKVVDNLTLFAQIRGGRVRSSSIVLKSRSKQMRQADIHPTSLMAMVPSLVMGSIGAGWKPTAGTLSDPAAADPSRSSAALYDGSAVVHHETDRSDPLAIRFAPKRGGSPRHSRNMSGASTTSGHSLIMPRGEATLAPPSPSR